MNSIGLTEAEFERLKKLSSESTKKLYLFPLFYIIPIILVAFIPAKYMPRRLRDTGKTFDGEESIISLIGMSNFLWFLLIWTIIMGIAALATYKNIGIKKDLKSKTKLKLKGIVSRVDSYEGKPYIRVKKAKGVKVLHFDESNYVYLSVGDEIEFEVYEHSKILIKILSRAAEKSNYNPAVINEVKDTCPACFHKLKLSDKVCPECGLNFS